MAEGSARVVAVALAGNLAIALTKFAAFAFTRSTAMLTEAIHSLVDTADQALLLWAQKRSTRPPNQAHPLGYGMETYFWSFLVVLLILLVGGAVSVWQGVAKIGHPAPIERPWLSYLVLAVSAGFEGASFRVAYREFRRMVRGRRVRGRSIPLWSFLQVSKDPSLFTTLMEDGAALTGLTIAALGVFGTSALHLPWADGAASIGIGLLLVGVATFLANETRSLIAGEAAAAPIREAVERALATCGPELIVSGVITLHLGPATILVVARVKLAPGVTGEAALAAARALEIRVKAADPRVGPVYLSLV